MFPTRQKLLLVANAWSDAAREAALEARRTGHKVDIGTASSNHDEAIQATRLAYESGKPEHYKAASAAHANAAKSALIIAGKYSKSHGAHSNKSQYWRQISADHTKSAESLAKGPRRAK